MDACEEFWIDSEVRSEFWNDGERYRWFFSFRCPRCGFVQSWDHYSSEPFTARFCSATAAVDTGFHLAHCEDL